MSKADEERSKRLAEALRHNLRRRKAQARGSAEEAQRNREGDDDRDDQPSAPDPHDASSSGAH